MLNLTDPSLLETRAYVNGEWLVNGKKFEVTNPSTNEKIAEVTDLSVADVSAAIDAAYDAQKAWAAKTGKERGAVMRGWFDLLVAKYVLW